MGQIAATRRLRLRELVPGDLDVLAAMVADADQMTFYPRPKTRGEAEAWIARNIGLYEEHGFGFWLVESLDGGSFAGYCGIRPLSLDGEAETEIGWHIAKAFWKRGIATEAATAARDLAFGRFDLPRVVALIRPDHLASRRVAENVGMRAERDVMLEEASFVLFSRSRPDRPRTRASR